MYFGEEVYLCCSKSGRWLRVICHPGDSSPWLLSELKVSLTILVTSCV